MRLCALLEKGRAGCHAWDQYVKGAPMRPFRQARLEGAPVASTPQPSASPCLVPGEICLRPADAEPAPRAPSRLSPLAVTCFPPPSRGWWYPVQCWGLGRHRKLTQSSASGCIGYPASDGKSWHLWLSAETQKVPTSSWYPLTWENLHGTRRAPNTTAPHSSPLPPGQAWRRSHRSEGCRSQAWPLSAQRTSKLIGERRQDARSFILPTSIPSRAKASRAASSALPYGPSFSEAEPAVSH